MNFDWSTTNLPRPTTDFSGQASAEFARTKLESGRIQQRRRFTSSWRLINVRWTFTDDEWTLFQGVVYHKLAQGASFFDIELPLGDGFRTFAVRFVAGSIQESYKDVMHWDVSAQLELADSSPLTEGEVDALLT